MEKTHYSLMIKTLDKLGVKRDFLSLIKDIYENPMTNIMLNKWKTEDSIPKIRNMTRISALANSVYPLSAVGLLLSCIWLFCDPMDCSLPGSSVCGVSQARLLEWAAVSFFRGSSQAREWTHVPCIGRWILYPWATWEAHQPFNQGI